MKGKELLTEDLYNPKDVTRVRSLLLAEQQNKDAITGLEIPPKQACLDHFHNDEQLVRAVLHRQTNASLGKLENIWTRYLASWYPWDLPTFLEQSAIYLRNNKGDKRWRHPNWQKKVKTEFNKLTTKQQDNVLVELGSSKGKNSVERKKLFAAVVLDRDVGFNKIKEVIEICKNLK